MKTRLLLALSCLFVLACDEPEPDPADDPCQSVPTLTWENFGKAHLDKHCNGCHSSQIRPEQRNLAPVGVDFDSYALTLTWAQRIYARGVESVDMPPGGGPSPEELSTFEEWMLCEVLPDA